MMSSVGTTTSCLQMTVNVMFIIAAISVTRQIRMIRSTKHYCISLWHYQGHWPFQVASCSTRCNSYCSNHIDCPFPVHFLQLNLIVTGLHIDDGELLGSKQTTEAFMLNFTQRMNLNRMTTVSVEIFAKVVVTSLDLPSIC